MDELSTNICQHYYTEECPHQLLISRSILIPQLIDPADLERAEEVCQTCEKCRGERRTSLRIKRPLKVTVDNDRIKNIEGTIVDISSTGARIKLEDSFDLRVGEFLDIKIYSNADNEQKQHLIKNQRCVIKRLAKQGFQLGVMFTNKQSVNQAAEY